jgi:hypothetical protein
MRSPILLRLALAGVLAGAPVATSIAHAETATDTAAKKKAPAKKAAPMAAKKKKAAPAEAEDKATAKRRRLAASPAYVVGDSNPHYIDVNAPKIVAFPQEAKAVEKAFAEGRRDQLIDAEKAARAARTPDRWRTVLFSLRGLHDRIDPEACFWRVLAFYRLGEIERARAVRADCEMPGKDSSTLNAEDAIVAKIPAIGTVPREDQFTMAKATEKPKTETAAPVAAGPDATPYTGPGPQRFQ